MKYYMVTVVVASALVIDVVIRLEAQGQNPQVLEESAPLMTNLGVVPSNSRNSSPIFVTEIPAGYRDWRLISVAREEGKLDDIRAILGNDEAITAYREGRPFPEGAIIARIAWSYLSSAENNKTFGRDQSFVAGAPKNGVQFMVKDSFKYAETGGWGYGHFNDGKPANEEFMRSCFPCHQAVETRDFVFARYAP